MFTEVRHKGSNQSSPGTPLLLLGVACQEDVFRTEDPFMIATAYVHRAHCYADAVRDVYVQLLDEDRKSMEQGACGYGSFHEAGEFSRGMAPPSPFLIAGRQEVRNQALGLLQGADELSQVTILGLESAHAQAASFLD